MEIPFYYDYACPWAYLGSCRVEAYFQDLGVTIDFRPVNLAALREPEAVPQSIGGMGERKKTNYMNDMRHWSEMIGGNVVGRSMDADHHDPAFRRIIVPTP